MPAPTHLNQPPIVEALIHFQANASERWAKPGAKELAKSLFPRHSHIEEQNQLSVQLQPGNVEPVQQVVHQLGNGFIMRATAEPTVHQVRRDGYSYSRLMPYEGWEPFVTAAKDGWGVYANAFQPDELHTLALRFINRLDFPADEFRQDRESFLTIAPRSPKGLEWGFVGFAHHYTLVVSNSPCVVNLYLVRLIEAGEEKAAAMLLDIEVVLAQPLVALGLSVDDALVMMRKAKNEAFFHSLTDKALSRYHKP